MSPDRNDFGPAVLDAINGGLIVLGSSRAILSWNVWMETASGISKEQAVGKQLEEAFPTVNLGRLTAAIDAAFTANASTIITHSLNPSVTRV